MVTLLGGHAGYLAVALTTHALVGFTLGSLLFRAPRAGLIGGLLADADLLFPAAWETPFVHRGITHTALAAAVAVALAARWGRATAGGVGIGYASQLLLDATTPKGIPLAYPFSPESFEVVLGGHSRPATVLLWLCCLLALWRYRRHAGRSDSSR